MASRADLRGSRRGVSARLRKIFQDLRKGVYKEEVSTDGTDRKPGKLAPVWEAPIRIAKAAALAHSITRDADFWRWRDGIMARVTQEMTVASVVQRSLVSDELEARSCAVSAAIDLYELTADRKHRQSAIAGERHVAEVPLSRSFRQQHAASSGSRQERAHPGFTTDARARAGWALNLIRLSGTRTIRRPAGSVRRTGWKRFMIDRRQLLWGAPDWSASGPARRNPIRR